MSRSESRSRAFLAKLVLAGHGSIRYLDVPPALSRLRVSAQRRTGKRQRLGKRLAMGAPVLFQRLQFLADSRGVLGVGRQGQILGVSILRGLRVLELFLDSPQFQPSLRIAIVP